MIEGLKIIVLMCQLHVGFSYPLEYHKNIESNCRIKLINCVEGKSKSKVWNPEYVRDCIREFK